MSNPMKYIKALEAVGFDRNQAEAQVQIVLDALEGDLVTKSDFAVYQERSENKLAQFEQRVDTRFAQFEQRVDARFAKLEDRVGSVETNLRTEMQILRKDLEFKLTTRLGAMMVGTGSIAVAILAWLIKV